MFRWLAAIPSFVVVPAFACENLHTPTAGRCFDTEVAAALAAGSRHVATSRSLDIEFIGAVLKTVNGYTFTVARGKPHRDRVTAKIRIPPRATLVAFWHTHGSRGYARKYFSDSDTALANSMDVPIYLMDPDGRLRVYNPGDRFLSWLESRKLGLGSDSRFARGSLVVVGRQVHTEPRSDSAHHRH